MDYRETSIPPEAERLLNLSIANSRVVLEKYPKSKHVEEAYYLLGSSMFLKENYTSSEEYFIPLIENYPNGKYFNEANLRLALIEIRNDNSNAADSLILILNTKLTLNKYEKYLLHNIYAVINIRDGNIKLAYDSYKEAIQYSASTQQRIKVYNNLIQISEENKDYENLLIFIDQLYNIVFIDSDKKELKLLSIDYNKKLNRYNYLVTEIEAMLNQSLFEDKRLYLSVELAKAYYHLKEYSVAEELLNELVDTYSKKNETAEAYYYLAKINIDSDFNLEKIKEFFEQSKSERSSSKHGKLSKKLIKTVETLEDIIYEYENTVSEEMNDEKTMLAADSLLFDMGQIYYFDFNQIDSSISTHSKLIQRFPDSKFAPKSVFVLSVLDSTNTRWNEMMSNNYTDYNFEDSNKTNSIDLSYSDEYYKALNLLELGFHEQAYPVLKESNLNNDNKESLFYLGYINEIYTADIKEMLTYYIQYVNEGKNEDNKNQAKEKLSSYYYIFNQKLKYVLSKNLLSNCLKDVDEDSLSLSISDCYSNIENETLEYSQDSLKIKYSDMQILNQSWTSFNRKMEFIENEYQINIDSLEVYRGMHANNEIGNSISEINQLRDFLALYQELNIKENNTISDEKVREENSEKESSPFQDFDLEEIDLEKLNLLKKYYDL